MTKSDIILIIHEKLKVTRSEASEYFETVLELAKETLVSGEELKISGFGKFVVCGKHARRGRNPHTGENLTISSRKILTFKASSKLKEEINSD